MLSIYVFLSFLLDRFSWGFPGCGWGSGRFGPGMSLFGVGGLFMWIIPLGIIALIVYLAVRSGKESSAIEGKKETPLEILKKRYAKGEIDREEFQRMKEDLE